MLASELISIDIPTLSVHDSVSKALDWMDVNRVDALPVVDKNTFLGFITEDDLLAEIDLAKKLQYFQHTFKIFFAKEDEHIFEVANKFQEFSFAFVAILSEEGKYLGCIESKVLLNHISSMPTFTNPGSYIILEMNSIDYSMGEIARLVESNDVKILGSFITKVPITNQIELTLKLNKKDIDAVIKTFERFNYNVTASYHKNETDDSIQKRYNELMHYLNI